MANYCWGITLEQVEWTGYSLDSQKDTTITGNTTLSGLPSGSHNLTIYASTTSGISLFGTVCFTTINTSTREPLPITVIILALSASTAVAGVGSLLYFNKI